MEWPITTGKGSSLYLVYCMMNSQTKEVASLVPRLTLTPVLVCMGKPGNEARRSIGVSLPTLCSALIRALFKSIVSLICPLIVFFFVLNKGRTRYDELTQSAVVDIRSLYRPVYANRRPHVQVG